MIQKLLIQPIQKLQKDEETGECIIFFEIESNTVIISCGYQYLCNICAKELVFKECPICRTSIPEDGIIKVFKC